jgi:hypothetical protein
VLACNSYISPEYAMHGEFSEFDVYSFCVLVLEIINGKKNDNFSPASYTASFSSITVGSFRIFCLFRRYLFVWMCISVYLVFML